MKLLGKIVVILIAALLVAGATLALDNSGALSSLVGGGPGERGERPAGMPADMDSASARGERPDADSAFAAGERPGRGGHNEGGDWAAGLLGLGRNLAVVAAVVAGVWLIGWLGGRTAVRRTLSKAEMPPKEKM
jgi:hypothetical protein